jgi:hypothetical protein
MRKVAQRSPTRLMSQKKSHVLKDPMGTTLQEKDWGRSILKLLGPGRTPDSGHMASGT